MTVKRDIEPLDPLGGPLAPEVEALPWADPEWSKAFWKAQDEKARVLFGKRFGSLGVDYD